MINVSTRVLDKICLLWICKGNDKSQFNDSLASAYGHVSNGDLTKKSKKHSTVFTKHYQGKTEPIALSFIYFAVQGKPAIRIEFCPRKLTDDNWADVISWFQVLLGVGEVWTRFYLSRAEVSLDFRIPYEELLFLDAGKKITNSLNHENGTQYIGSYTGRSSLCIYNKTKQLSEVKGIDISYPVTRIEEKQAGLKLRLNQINKLKQPFAKLIAIRKATLTALEIKNSNDAEFVEFCKQVLNGQIAQQAYCEQSTDAQKRIINILKPHRIKLRANDDRWGSWKDEQAHLLSRIKDC